MEKLLDSLKFKEPVWCDKCGFNLVLVSGKCLNCQKIEQDSYNDNKYNQDTKEQQKARLIAKLGGYRAYSMYTAERFKNRKILEDLKDFPKINIFIYGSVGTGKTHLGTALIRKCDNFNRFSSIEICRELRKTQKSDNPAMAEDDLIRKFCETPLMIDDFGVEKSTDFAKQTLYEIIDKRYELGNGGLIITSNFELGSSRVSSRIYEMCKIIKLDGQDFRLKFKEQ